MDQNAKITGFRDLSRHIEELAEGYRFRRPDEVYAFLGEEPSALALASKAHGVIREHFAEDEIFMEVFADPNSPEEKELLISISTSLTPEEAIRRLDAFDENWWLSASASSAADICIKVEYR
jgi:class 3 adenylate cyclase